MSYALRLITKPESEKCPECDYWIREEAERLEVTAPAEKNQCGTRPEITARYHPACGIERFLRSLTLTGSLKASHELIKAVCQMIVLAPAREEDL